MKKNYLFFSILTVLTFSFVFLFSAFTTKKASPSEFWVYTSSDATGFTSATKYEKITIDPEDNAVCMPGSAKPCVLVEVNSNNDDQSKLQSHLNSTYNQSSQSAKDAAVLADAISSKN